MLPCMTSIVVALNTKCQFRLKFGKFSADRFRGSLIANCLNVLNVFPCHLGTYVIRELWLMNLCRHNPLGLYCFRVYSCSFFVALDDCPCPCPYQRCLLGEDIWVSVIYTRPCLGRTYIFVITDLTRRCLLPPLRAAGEIPWLYFEVHRLHSLLVCRRFRCPRYTDTSPVQDHCTSVGPSNLFRDSTSRLPIASNFSKAVGRLFINFTITTSRTSIGWIFKSFLRI